MIRKLLKILKTGGNVDKLAEFETVDTVTATKISNDPTGKTHILGTNQTDVFDNLDSEIVRIDGEQGGSKPAFHAYSNTAIVFSFVGSNFVTETQKLIFDLELFDTKNSFNTTTSEFTASQTGFYQFNVAYGYGNPYNEATTFMAVYINGSETHQLFRGDKGVAEEETLSFGTTINDKQHICSIKLKLNINDKVDIRVTHTNYNTRTITSASGKEKYWFSGYLIQ